VKPGEDDYLDTSFLLRQASPYMKIKYCCPPYSFTDKVSFLSSLLISLRRKEVIIEIPTDSNVTQWEDSWLLSFMFFFSFIFIVVIFSGTPISRILLIWFLKREAMFP
jgi:hypothetical protein